MTCNRCGHTLELGEWPFCPHGFPIAGVSVIDDQLEGGARWCETMADQPVWFDGTKSQYRNLCEQHQVRNVVRHDAAYYARLRRRHDEELRDLGTNREY